MKKTLLLEKINLLQIIQILDAINNTFLSFLALSLKQGKTIDFALERAKLLLAVDRNNQEGRKINNFMVSTVSDSSGSKTVQISYNPRGEGEFIFLIQDVSSRSCRDKHHQIEIQFDGQPNYTNLVQFIYWVVKKSDNEQPVRYLGEG